MTPAEYRTAIAALGLNQSEAARLLGVDARTSRRWAAGHIDVPGPVDRLLRIMIAAEITPADLREILGLPSDTRAD